MNWILDRLMVGDLADATSHIGQYDALITLCAERPTIIRTRWTHWIVPDNAPWEPDVITAQILTMRLYLWQGHRLLVHCHGGVTRSPALCGAYLIACGWDTDTALRHIQRKRPFACNMHPVVWDSVLTWWREGTR